MKLIEKYLNEKSTSKIHKVEIASDKARIAVSELVRSINSWEDRDKLDKKTKNNLNKLLDNIEHINKKIDGIFGR